MFELTADGSDPRQHWRKQLEIGGTYLLGRDAEAELLISWDSQISRQHVQIELDDDGLIVKKLSSASNPLFFEGHEVETCHVAENASFVLGSTAFHVTRTKLETKSPEVQPVEEVTFSRQKLQQIHYRDADKRIEVLTHLPKVILNSRTDLELYHQLVNLLMAGIPQADAIAVVQLDKKERVTVLHWERRLEATGNFHPSSHLVADAISKHQNSILHIWESSEQNSSNYTVMGEFDWAFCTPIPATGNGAWGFYIAGRLDRPEGQEVQGSEHGVELHADVKFTELVAEVISSVRRVSRLERQQTVFRQFFAPPVVSALEDDPNQLEPRECDVTVMFCDLRGFSRQAEESADNLLELLDRVSLALGVMNHNIRDFGGVTADFQGDAVLGFWGWPFASSEATLDACRAALKIRSAFTETIEKEGHPLSNFRMGIGIAHGRAVAGKIGTDEQLKVTVFGPVVNLASRLEGMTKQLRVPIVLDEATAEIIRSKLDPMEGRIRRLAKVLPYGIETPVVVSELLPSELEWPELTAAHLEQYEQGVEHFITGRWEEAYRCLHDMPAGDRAQDFPIMMIAQHNRIPPENWDGVAKL